MSREQLSLTNLIQDKDITDFFSPQGNVVGLKF